MGLKEFHGVGLKEVHGGEAGCKEVGAVLVEEVIIGFQVLDVPSVDSCQ